MTVVKLQNFAAEDFVYLYLKQYDLDTIRDFTLPKPHYGHVHRRYGGSLGKILSGNIDTMYDSLSSACKDHRSVLFPYNGLPPYQGSQTNWFDLQSDNEFAINIKYAYDSSANSRIRDLTRSAVSALNEFLLKENVLNQHRHLSYDEIRNNRLHAISKQIKRNQSPTYNDIDLLYIKYTYLFCMNFIESKEIVNNIFFINFNLFNQSVCN